MFWCISVLLYLYSSLWGISGYVFPLGLAGCLILYLINPFPILHHSSRMWLLKVLVSTVFWCISVLLYLYSSLWGISGYVFPLGLAGCLILYLINPFPILHHSSRMWLLKVLVSTVFWCISVLLYLYSSLWGISGYVFPLGLAGCLILYLINPFPILHHSSRMWLLKVLVSTVFWCISVLLYLYSSLWGISGYVFPLGLAGCLILYLINPFPILHHSSRMWLLKVLVSTVFWCISVLLYLYSSLWGISGYVFPLGLAGCLILYLINPFPILHHSSRMWLLKVLVSTVFWCISVLLYLYSSLWGISGYVFPLGLAGCLILYLINPFPILHHSSKMWLLKVLVSTVFWCISVLLYLYSSLLGISGYVFPLGLAGCLILYLINPFPILHHSSRMWLLKVLVSTLRPLHPLDSFARMFKE